MNNEEERKAMETEEEKAVFTELIREIGWVFHHPILREWVKVAPSVNSIDNWISFQFDDYSHKLKLIKAMRKAVRAWKMVKGDTHKELLRTPHNWRLSDMFIFDPNITTFPGEDKKDRLSFSLAVRFLPSLNPQEGIGCSGWPMFLREFGYKASGNFKTSVDRWGDASQFWLMGKIGNRFWEDGKAEVFKGNPKNLNSFAYELSINHDSRVASVWADILLKQFGIKTQIIRVEPQDGEIYPRFYKTVYLCDHRHGEVIHSVKVVWPIDCYGENQKGRVVFSKSIGVAHQEMRAILEIEYEFDNIQFKLVAIPESIVYKSHSYIKLETSGHQSILFKEESPVPETKKVTEAMGILFEDFVAAWEFSIKNRGRISLESILGESILTSPPDSLIQIFTGSRIADDLSGKYRE